MTKARLTIGGHTSRIELPEGHPIQDDLIDEIVDYETATGYEAYLPLTIEEAYCKLYRPISGGYEFPSGVIERMLRALGKPQIELIKSVIPTGVIEPLEFPKDLREYQVEAVSIAYKHKRLQMRIPTGGGKTYVIGEIARGLSLHAPVLIVVPTRQLLNQTIEAVGNYLNRNGSGQEIGKIGEGEYRPQVITVGILDSLVRYKEYLKTVGVAIFDECHCYANISGSELCKGLENTRYRIGLSATPEPGNGLSWLLESLIGPLSYEVSIERLIGAGVIMQPHVEMHIAPYKKALGKLFQAGRGALKGKTGPQILKMEYTHWSYNILYNYLIVLNEERNQLIVDIAVGYMDSHKGYPLAIIIKKVKSKPNHIDELVPLLQARGYDLPVICGSSKKTELAKVLQDMREGTIPGVICGPETISVGTDIPNLGGILVACAGSSAVNILQRPGRVMRYEEGKPSPVVIDFIDGISFFASQSNKRRGSYEEAYQREVKVYGSGE